MEKNVCPVCGNEYEDDVRICVPCKIDLRTGDRILTNFKSDKTQREIRAEALAELESQTTWRDYFFGTFPGLLQPKVLIVTILLFLFAIALGILGMCIVGMGAMMEGMTIAGMGLICYAQCLAMLMGGRITLMQECLVDFVATQWYVFLGFFCAPMFLWVLTLLLYARFIA